MIKPRCCIASLPTASPLCLLSPPRAGGQPGSDQAAAPGMSFWLPWVSEDKGRVVG